MIIAGSLLIALVVAVFAAAACMPRRLKDKPWSNVQPRECDDGEWLKEQIAALPAERVDALWNAMEAANIKHEGSHPGREGSTPWVEGDVHSSTQHGQDEAPSAHGPFDHATTISYHGENDE
jgi:hypothetical protein